MKPRKLKILDGRPFRGHIRVESKLDDGTFIVDFDAYDDKARAEHWVGDRANLTADQIKYWTGVEIDQ